jgi:tRNA threonylcarbamoyladenosine biosynthesis protein TsaE
MTISAKHIIRDINLKNVSECQKVASHLSLYVRTGDIITFTGNLGTGKTEFCRSLIHALGFHEEVPSPTFNLVQVYEHPIGNGKDISVWHLDLYRLEKAEDVFELGIDDAFETAVTLIEWPDRMVPYLPEDHLQIFLSMGDQEGSRNLIIKGSEYWSKRLENIKF